jgi:alpha-1,6-mannosyltransferase
VLSDTDLIAAADVALSPSPVETFGLATLEALACGTPVVVPAGGAVRELLGAPGAGAVCDGTARGIAGAVREVLQAPADPARTAAWAVAERFAWKVTVSGLLACYTELGRPESVTARSVRR